MPSGTPANQGDEAFLAVMLSGMDSERSSALAECKKITIELRNRGLNLEYESRNGFPCMTVVAMKMRCPWARSEPNLTYHDTEWGLPQHDDRVLFEFLILEGAQAGLSWSTILQKRANYRRAFDDFDPVRIAKYGDAKIEKLLANDGIVRNRLKILATVKNAKCFLAVQEECGSFDRYIWQFVGGRTLQNAWKSLAQIPTRAPEAERMSKDLLRRGFKFVGPTICYAFMQAVGLVNDHLVSCFRYGELRTAR